MDCAISWNTMTLDEWNGRFEKIVRSNLLQSYDYARAICQRKGMKARWGLIRMDGAEAGIVQILEAGIFGNALHAVILDRGPLWFEGFDSVAHAAAFFATFDREFPRRFGRRRRVIPELADTPENRQAMIGFKRLSRPGYQTSWLDLRQDTESLWHAMESSWRNKVRKAERECMEIEWDEKGTTLLQLLRVYQSDRRKKGYDGPSVATVRALTGKFRENRSFLAGLAKRDGEILAAVLVLRHGRGATYQVGWSTAAGKEIAAHNLLLWRAATILKDRGVDFFDLGGVNDQSAQGVKKFKEGMGGETLTLAGHYT
jgi:hypothetical protein